MPEHKPVPVFQENSHIVFPVWNGVTRLCHAYSLEKAAHRFPRSGCDTGDVYITSAVLLSANQYTEVFDAKIAAFIQHTFQQLLN